MASAAAVLIVFDILGKLRAHGHGLGASCRRYVGVPMNMLIPARGVDSPVAGMRPPTCAGCMRHGRGRSASRGRRRAATGTSLAASGRVAPPGRARGQGHSRPVARPSWHSSWMASAARGAFLVKGASDSQARPAGSSPRRWAVRAMCKSKARMRASPRMREGLRPMGQFGISVRWTRQTSPECSQASTATNGGSAASRLRRAKICGWPIVVELGLQGMQDAMR
jgi:hypothetical protein